MKRVEFFTSAFMDGLETAVSKAEKMGVPNEKIKHWEITLRNALSPA